MNCIPHICLLQPQPGNGCCWIVVNLFPLSTALGWAGLHLTAFPPPAPADPWLTSSQSSQPQILSACPHPCPSPVQRNTAQVMTQPGRFPAEPNSSCCSPRRHLPALQARQDAAAGSVGYHRGALVLLAGLARVEIGIRSQHPTVNCAPPYSWLASDPRAVGWNY